jgi:hypothetical protein
VKYDQVNDQAQGETAGNRLRAPNQGQPGERVPSVNLGVIK